MEQYLNGLQHIGLPVKDVDEACAFYRSLAFSPVLETLQPNGKKVSFLRQGNLTLEVYECEDIAGKTGAIDHFTLDCTDIEAACRECEALGYRIETNGIESLPYWNNGIRFFKIQGPAGEMIEFCQIL